MNAKDLSLFLQVFANEQGVSKDTAMDWVLEAFSAYAAKTQSKGHGVYVTRFEDNVFCTYRTWELIADDIVMEDTERQWRVLDAVDEGFENAEVGDLVEVEVPKVELTRQFKTWMYQYMLRKMPQTEKKYR